ncbi:MAG TPA: selenocysteine-specific translation elongation factor, partial [Anaerolineae bacterium]|nr:selenocysteine-specific translation elongation factor [Anaerolineae bacterium]
MRVIGTAGHVDHGKSTLVQALTGTHPDRLKEEREREMTIDLGFAWLTLPTGEAIGIVDVPGHIDFIENMLAGVGSIDAALFVIAADEGVMPQTREHLAILDLLKIDAGVVALTKTDLVEAEWLELIELDVREALQGTVLASAPIMPVSARSGTGVPELLQALDRILQQRPPRPDRGRPRHAIDRVFSIAGFGTVVTGTLIDGSLRVGDEVVILPQNLAARIRGLQTHKTKIDVAVPGSRVAINLSGVELTEVQRGSVVTTPGWLTPTVLIDSQFEHLASSPRPLAHNAQVKFFHGAAEVNAHLRLLNDEQLAPGHIGWVQFALREPLPLVKGDRFIARLPSPSLTLGGGVVIDPQPGRRHRRFRPEVIARLETLARGTPSELLLKTLEAGGPLSSAELFKRASLSKDEAQAALRELLETQQARPLKADIYISASAWAALRHKIGSALTIYHQANPLKIGVPREEMKSRLGLETKTFNLIVEQLLQENVVAATGSVLHAPDFAIVFKPEQQKAIEVLVGKFKAAPWNTPLPKEAEQIVGSDVLAALIDLGRLVKLSEDVLLLAETYRSGVEQIRAHLSTQKTLTVAQVRDLFTTSRKYALALME